MRILLLIATSWLALNVAVYAAIGWTVGWPGRSPPIDVPIPKGLPTRMHRDTSEDPDDAGVQILLDDFAVQFLLDVPLLSRAERPQLLVLGASSAAMALRPEWLQPYMADHQVSNLALYGTNLTAVRQTLDACLSELHPTLCRRSVVVLGVNHVMFRCDTAGMARQTNVPLSASGMTRRITIVDRAMLRCPLVLDDKHRVGRMLPTAMTDLLRERLRFWHSLVMGRNAYPGEWLAGQAWWRLQTPAAREHRIRRIASQQPGPKTWSEIRKMNVAELAERLTRSTPPSGPELDGDQFEQFVAIVRDAVTKGLHVVVIDMPLHRLCRDAVNLEPYHQKLVEALEPFVREGSATLIDLSAAVEEEYFSDLVHPSRKGLRRWSTVLGENLAREIARQSPRSRD